MTYLIVMALLLTFIQVGLLPLAFNLGNVDYLMGNRDESNPEPLWEEQRGREVICWKACPAFSH